MKFVSSVLVLVIISVFAGAISASAERKHVTIIKDYHCHNQTQKKVAEIIFDLNSNSKIPVFIEGAYGRVYLDYIANYADKSAVKEISDNLLENGFISGAEYYSIITNRSDSLWGVDDRNYYLKSYDIFTKVISLKPELDLIIDYFDSKIEVLKENIFSRKLSHYEMLRNSFKQGETDIYDYIFSLRNNFRELDLSFFPEISCFVQLTDKIRSVDTLQYEADKNKFFKFCQNNIDPNDYSILQKNNYLMTLNKISLKTYWQLIDKIIHQYNINPQNYSFFVTRLSAHAELLNLSSKVDEEMELLDRFMFKHLSNTYEEAKLAEIILFKEYISDLFNFNIPAYMIDTYRDLIDNFDFYNACNILNRNGNMDFCYSMFARIAQVTDLCCQFYDLTKKRDEIMVQNIVRKIQEENESSEFILLCGAMHIENLKGLLSDYDIEVSVNVPQITSKIDNAVYLKRMMSESFTFDGIRVSPVNLAFASLFTKKPFLQKLTYSNMNVPISRAVKVALVGKTINHFFYDSTGGENTAQELIDRVNDILKKSEVINGNNAADIYEEHLRITSMYISDFGDQISFDCNFLPTKTSKRPQKIRVSLTPDLNVEEFQDFVIFPEREKIMSLRTSFITSLLGKKSRFDELILMAKNNPDEVGKILFGQTFTTLNKVPSDYVERHHFKGTGKDIDPHTSPYSHTMDVAKNLNLNGIESKYHRAMRLATLTHNLWKIYNTYEDFKLIQAENIVEFSITHEEEVDGQIVQTTEHVKGTIGEISAKLIPAVLSDMGVTLEDWEYDLLVKLVETNHNFGIIGLPWDVKKAREEFSKASDELNMPLKEFMSLARRIYEADILSIYVNMLPDSRNVDIEALLDISDRCDRILGIVKLPMLPSVGEDKFVFFESLDDQSADFGRCIAKAMADDKYAERIFPSTLLKLREIPHDATPVIHRDPESDIAINPFNHSLNAANQLNVENITNIRALRIATLLHDIGKLKFESYRSKGYPFHAEKSAEMVEDVLKEWGIIQRLSVEEIALIKYLVKNHDVLIRHTQSNTGWMLNNVLKALELPDELTEAGFQFLDGLKYVRRVQQADSDSVPKLAGKLDFNKHENVIGAQYVRNHPDLWDELSDKYCRNIPIQTKNDMYAINLAIAQRQGLKNGYTYEDVSPDITRKRVLQAQPLRELGAFRKFIDDSA